ncbi:MAG: hypothetical protein IIC18_05010 [Bacteroidetes bacterium]|nr:hypothetical protein [Bacteroidota bacterium]
MSVQSWKEKTAVTSEAMKEAPEDMLPHELIINNAPPQAMAAIRQKLQDTAALDIILNNNDRHMDNLTITINADSPMGPMTMTNTMNGTSTGTYAVDADTLRFTDGTGNMTTNTEMMMGGRQMSSSSSDLESVFETSDRSLMTYECTGDVLLINVHENADGGGLVFEGMRFVRSGGPA